MKHLSLLLLLLTVIPASSFIHYSDNVISWNKEKKLTWDDFQGDPNPDSQGDAATAIRIIAEPYYVKRKLHYKIQALFIPSKSWYRYQTDALLAHEQLHFDLAELYAREARKKVAELQKLKVSDIDVYNAAIQKILNESNQADVDYDLETLHGSLPKAQERWKFKIELSLSILADYAL